MRIAIFGATGPTGQELIKQALKNGYAVTAFVRSSEKLSVKDDNLTIIKGDALRYDDVEKAVKGQDAVLSALGVKPPSKIKAVGPGVANIIKAMERHGVKRLIVESAFFMDEQSRKSPFVRLLTATFMKGLFEDKKEQNKHLRNSSVLWTEVRPAVKLASQRRLGFVQFSAGDRAGVVAVGRSRAAAARLSFPAGWLLAGGADVRLRYQAVFK